jgi:K+ transporter
VEEPGAVLAAVRDVALIVLAVESIVLGVLAAILIVRLLAFIDVAQERLDDVAGTAGTVLESARDAAEAANQAAAQVRGSTSFLSDQVVTPAIRVASAVSGASRFARTLVGLGGNSRRGKRGKAE